MISYPHLSTILLYDMSRRWIQYLNRCMAASDSEVVEAPGAIIPFSLSPVLVDLERGIYLGPILPEPLADLIAGQRALGGNIRSVGDPCGGTRSVCSGGKPKKYRVGAAAGAAGVRVRYDAHLPALSLWERENSRTLLEGKVLTTVHGHILCKNWHLCRVC